MTDRVVGAPVEVLRRVAVGSHRVCEPLTESREPGQCCVTARTTPWQTMWNEPVEIAAKLHVVAGGLRIIGRTLSAIAPRSVEHLISLI